MMMNMSSNSFHTMNNNKSGRIVRPLTSTSDRDNYIEKILTHYVWQALDFDMLDSAEFTMEKLLAIDPENPSSKHLMGLILYRQGRYKAAANVTNCNTNHMGCVYIYARSCLKLKIYRKGIDALERTKHEWSGSGKSSGSTLSNERWIIPDQAVLNALLGKLYHLQGDKVDAVKAYSSSVRMNPFIWDPVESLCRLGVKLRVSNAFRVDLLVPINSDGTNGGNSVSTSSLTSNAPVTNDPFTTPVGGSSGSTISSNPFTFKYGQQFLKNSTTTTGVTNSTTKVSNEESSSLPASTIIKTPASSHTTPNDSSFNTPSDSRASRQTHSGLPLAPQKRSSRNVAIPPLPSVSTAGNVEPKPNLPFPRRSARLARTTQPTTTIATGQKRSFVTPSSRPNLTTAPATTTIPPPPHRPLSQSTATTSLHPPPSLPAISALKRGRLKPDRDSVAKKESQLYIINLYRQLTSAYIHFCGYECRQAIGLFCQLPEQQKNTPWVLSKLGRCHFEIVDYNESERVFEKLRQLDRCRIRDMEYYSTLLWHLRKDVELSFLAHELMEIDRTSPQAWCTLGNSFSLKRETGQALKCFKRAIGIDPDSPYAYTLLAHEQVATEAYESAQDSFRLAIRADNRHYNAWYGLGMVFMRLDNFQFAEHHFSRAAIINPSNVVLICCIGMVLEKKGHFTEALEQYKKACEIQPNSALARYKKARALIHLKLYNAALVEFDHLQKLAPDEASVHFLLGQLYKLLNNRDLAIKHFTIALNLDPKGSGLIKDAIEGLNVFNTTT